jgi:hypothetical protein
VSRQRVSSRTLRNERQLLQVPSRGVRSTDPGRQIQICAWPTHHFLTFGTLGGADVISRPVAASEILTSGPTQRYDRPSHGIGRGID